MKAEKTATYCGRRLHTAMWYLWEMKQIGSKEKTKILVKNYIMAKRELK